MNHTHHNPHPLLQQQLDAHIIFVAFVSGFMLLIYDHLLTLSMEVEYIWKRRFTLSTLLFFVLRYSTILETILSLIVFIPGIFQKIHCDIFLRVVNVLNVLSVILISATMAIRIMALCTWSRIAVFALSGLLIIQLLCLVLFTGELDFVPVPRKATCISTRNASFITILWWSPLIVDTILIGLTLYRLSRLQQFSTEHSPLLHTLKRDGILYYGVICVAYTGNILNYYVNPNNSKGAGSIFGIVLPCLMICRLILNLQNLPPPEFGEIFSSDEETSDSGGFTTLQPKTHFFRDQWGTTTQP